MSFSFKKSEVLPQDDFKPIEPGIYDVKFEDVEEKQTQSGGVQWSAKMKIVATGRTFFLNWNVENANEKTQEIARREIAQIVNCMGSDVEDISINTLRTNAVFTVSLEQREYLGKIYYQTKGAWKLAAPAAQKIPTFSTGPKTTTAAPTAPAKKAAPWTK